MIYEINHIWTAEMKWKWRNDRRSECNLCNCVKKPEKKLKSWKIFQASLCNCINCVHCDDHFFIFVRRIHVLITNLRIIIINSTSEILVYKLDSNGKSVISFLLYNFEFQSCVALVCRLHHDFNCHDTEKQFIRLWPIYLRGKILQCWLHSLTAFVWQIGFSP